MRFCCGFSLYTPLDLRVDYLNQCCMFYCLCGSNSHDLGCTFLNPDGKSEMEVGKIERGIFRDEKESLYIL